MSNFLLVNFLRDHKRFVLGKGSICRGFVTADRCSVQSLPKEINFHQKFFTSKVNTLISSFTAYSFLAREDR